MMHITTFVLNCITRHTALSFHMHSIPRRHLSQQGGMGEDTACSTSMMETPALVDKQKLNRHHRTVGPKKIEEASAADSLSSCRPFGLAQLSSHQQQKKSRRSTIPDGRERDPMAWHGIRCLASRAAFGAFSCALLRQKAETLVVKRLKKSIEKMALLECQDSWPRRRWGGDHRSLMSVASAGRRRGKHKSHVFAQSTAYR